MHASRVPSDQFPQFVPYRVNASSHLLGWQGFRVEVVRGHDPGEITLPPLDHHLLNMIVSARTWHEHRWDGQTAESVSGEGSIAIVPAGSESYWRWHYLTPDPPCDFHIHLHPAFVRRAAVNCLSELPPELDLHGELCFEHPEVRVVAEALLREVEAGGRNGSLYAESLATALVTLLLTRQNPSLHQPARTERKLPVKQIKTVCDYIDGHLGEDLHLEALGLLAGLGPDRLRHVFRAVMGESPHRYVTRRRLERARQVLRRTSLPLTEIALSLGFSDHSHFTSVFHREVGVTPSRFREEARR